MNVVTHYQSNGNLFPSEIRLVSDLSDKISRGKILDIGVGGGRTTNYLLGVNDDYTGVDYVPNHAVETQRKFPAAKILCLDARDMSLFDDETFDFVLFSFNGLDSLSHIDRLKAFNEIYRVLKNGGTFMFSSHNRDYRYFNKLPWRRKFEFNTRFLFFFLYCLYHMPKHLKMKRHEVQTDAYAVVNDSDHQYSLLLYYIDFDNQRKQLNKIGFYDVQGYDSHGEPVIEDQSSHWIYYVATKASNRCHAPS